MIIYKLINNEIDCSHLLEKLNFKINTSGTKDKSLFCTQNVCFNYSINYPANMLMSIGNSTQLHNFRYNINGVKLRYSWVNFMLLLFFLS